MLQEKRHTLSHLLAKTILDEYPNALLTIGPPTNDGFYYDINFGSDVFGTDKFEEIEKKMRKNLTLWSTYEIKEVEEKEVRELFKNNKYKLELIDEIVAKNVPISVVKWGDFIDLCEGGHIKDAKDINPDSFKIAYTSGVYWRGDENNDSITRIYCYAFDTKKELEEYLENLEKAKERDHRKIGKELDLFTFSKLVGSGLPMFTPKGNKIRLAIINKINDIQKKYNYEEVWIPHITKPELYKKSGHLEQFGDDLFKVYGKNNAEFVLKPMNCPHHTQIFNSTLRSYKDLPQRYSEVTTVYRDELPGELLGLSRVRSITQDDGHVFCSITQVKEEVKNIISIVSEFYSLLDMFNEDCYKISLSVRDPNKLEKYLGDDEIWNTSENILEEILKDEKLTYEKIEGEAAFYGPKIDFKFKDSLNREWQLSTIQLDFIMPERFDLSFINSKGKKETPVMIHRAIAGSLERFLSVMIEHLNGKFPFWLSPTQVTVVSVSDAVNDYAEKIFNQLKDYNYRVEIDISNKKLGSKIHKAKKQLIPYIIIVGEKDKNENKITLEKRDGDKQTISIENCLEIFKKLDT